MPVKKILFFVTLVNLLASCSQGGDKQTKLITVDSQSALGEWERDTMPALQDSQFSDQTINRQTEVLMPAGEIDIKNVHPTQLIAFAKTQIGVPYKYASSHPSTGFDCSGFITYVFNHFGIKVPRSSIDFTHVGKEIQEKDAKPGDIILFTGTDSTERFVGHMGLITSKKGQPVEFIHSTSGKAYGVTITPFNDYYRSRFVKFIRIFPQND